MNDFLELLAVLAAIYIFDCVHWTRRGTVAFRRFFGAKMALLEGEDMPGNERYGVVFAQPLPPFGRLFLTQHAPLALTKDVACSFVAQATNPGPRPPQVERAVRYDAIRSIELEARRVLVDGALFVEMGSNRGARRTAALLETLRGLDAKKREKAIARELAASLDVDAVSARIAQFEAATSVLTGMCMVAFILLFVIVPALGLHLGLALTWLPIGVAVLGSQLTVVFAFVRAHRDLYPDERRARRSEAIMLFLSPPAAVRAVDVLSRDLLAEFHPLAVACAALERESFEEFAARVLRDARNPLPIRRDGGDALVHATDLEWRERIVQTFEDWAERHGIARERWTAPPVRLAADCRTYCPRCVEQFTLDAGTCTRCWDLPLAHF